LRARFATVLLSPMAAKVAAHGEAASRPTDLWRQWDMDLAVVLPLLVATLWYGTGLYRLWGRAGVGRGISPWLAGAYAGGTIVLVIALVSPLDAAANALFSLHMVQHLLLILVAPPLLVVGAADVAFLWGLPRAWRRRFGRFEHGLGRGLSGETSPVVPLCVVLLATGVLWLWHVPDLYDLAVRVEAWHIAEHAGFLVTALLFWATVLRLRPRDHVNNGLRLVYVFGMAMQGSLLGALITFATRPLYQSHLATAPPWGLEPLVDQQLAGLIMWVPPALLYLGVVAYLFVHWLNAVDARRRDAPVKGPGA
jgi:putative membrane protein